MGRLGTDAVVVVIAVELALVIGTLTAYRHFRPKRTQGEEAAEPIPAEAAGLWFRRLVLLAYVVGFVVSLVMSDEAPQFPQDL